MFIDPTALAGESGDTDDMWGSSASVAAAVRGQLEVSTVFQPIVSLDDEKVAGYEALSRWSWPDGGAISPEMVFLAAATAGDEVLGELDRRCIRAAAGAAARTNLPQGGLLLINTEPTTQVVSVDELGLALADACAKYRVVFEFTERGLSQRPGALLAKVAALRTAGIGIAVDDVGHDPDILAWLDVIDPDIIKLDMSLIQRHPAPEQARVLTAVYGYHERSGALIVAEGIETDAHLEQARAVGATLGQGYRFGAPGEHVAAPTADAVSFLTAGRPRRPIAAVGTPFELVKRHRSIRIARKQLVAAFSRDITTQAVHATDRPMVLAAVQHAKHLEPVLARSHYRQLAQASSLIVVFGQAMPDRVGSAVIGVELDPADPLCAQWTLVTLGSSHTAFALFAREHHQHPSAATAPDDGRLFEFVITTDRTLVVSAAAHLLARIP